MEWLAKRLGYKKQSDWYAICGEDFRSTGGAALLASYYAGSYTRAVTEVFHELEWNEWQFATTPDGFWESPSNRKRYLDWLAAQLGFTSANDWHGLTWELLNEHNGLGLHKQVGSVIGMVRERYPSEEIKEWLFASVPKGFWDKKKNRHRYLDWLGSELGYRTREDWYRTTKSDFNNRGGAGLIQLKYRSSVAQALKDRFPDVEWCEWLLEKVPQRFWHDKRNCRRYLDWLGPRLGFKRREDWYQITSDAFKENAGAGLLQTYGFSPIAAVTEIYSDTKWDTFAFASKPQRFWQERKNQRLFLERLSAALGYKSRDDFYNLTTNDVVENGGRGLLPIYGGSHTKAVMRCFPEYDWVEWRFKHVPQRFWSDPKNVVRYLRWLGKHLGFRKPQDWYQVTTKSFSENGGAGLLSLRFNGSAIRATKHLFPHFEWHEWKFLVCPNGFWKDKCNRKRYLVWLGGELGIRDHEDWYTVTKDKLNAHYGAGLLDYCNGSQAIAIVEAFPQHTWDVENFSYMRMNQKRIFCIIRERYHDAVWQYKHPDLRFSDTGRKMELDIWIPSIKTAVEYQGQQHFMAVDSWGGKTALRKLRKRDAEKRRACLKCGIRLIEISYSWDGLKESVFSCIEP